MEELKLLVEMVGNLPSMALWVIAAFWAYKVIVIGSLYGLIRFAIEKAHNWLTVRKTLTVDVRLMLDDECISGTKDNLMRQLKRIKRTTGHFVHGSDVAWLEAAIDEKIAKEQAAKGA